MPSLAALAKNLRQNILGASVQEQDSALREVGSWIDELVLSDKGVEVRN
jgi:hypothetical protein